MYKMTDWIQTGMGTFDYINIEENEVPIAEIAHALGKLCRYVGHSIRFYSVAEHCVLVSQVLEDLGADPKTQLRGLLHDASEAYMGDIASPLKKFLPDYVALEDRVEEHIFTKYGVLDADEQLINMVDKNIVKDERMVLFFHENIPFVPACDEQEPLGVAVSCWEWGEAAQQYRDRYDVLLGKVIDYEREQRRGEVRQR